MPSPHTIAFQPVERPRLLDGLDGVLEQPLALVVAPAGYGKSVLVADWLDRRCECDSIWVSMDERDNDVARFWARIVRGFDETLLTETERASAPVRRADPDAISAVAESLIDTLGVWERDLVIVLDDVHLVTDKDVIDSWARFMDDLPSSVHVILIARHDLPLPARRLRAAGRLIEIREGDLRFTIDETHELLENADVEISDPAIASLNSRTEGWGVALRLAALSLVNEDDPEAAVDSLGKVKREIADYLVEELLADMHPDEREFLVVTSAVNELDEDLAYSLSGREDSSRILQELVASGSFTTPVPDRPGWYRYHQLFRELLRTHLSGKSPDTRRELRKRAADYHHEQGALTTAVRYAIDAEEYERATEWLFEAYESLMNSGRAATLAGLADDIISKVEQPDTRVLFVRMWALYLLQDEDDRLAAAETALLERIETPDQNAPSRSESASPVLDLMTGPGAEHWYRAAQARRLGDIPHVLEYNTDEFIPSPSGRLEWYVAEAMAHAEHYAEASDLLSSIEPAIERQGYAPALSAVIGLRALVTVGTGAFGEAEALIDRGMAIAHSHQLGLVIPTMFTRLSAVWLAWERGDLEAAESSAVDVQRFAEYSSDVPIVATHAALRSRIRWSLGDRTGARNSLDRASVLASGRRVRGDFSERLLLARARLDLLENDLMAAEQWMPDWRERFGRGGGTLREHLVLLRFQLAAGSDLSSVYSPVPHEDQATPLHRYELARIRSLAMLAQGRIDDATDTLAKSLSEAARVGAMQGFVDDRLGLARILEPSARKASISLPGLEPTAAQGGPVYVEPLSEREMDVLRLMRTHMTYPEIGDELFVSINTVRSHVKSIYRKLAVSSRSDAVDRARAYGMLD